MKHSKLDNSLSESIYKNSLKKRYPCYSGVCWALSKIEEEEPSKQVWQDARATFLDLYPFAVQELGKEASSLFIESIKAAESRREVLKAVEKPLPPFRDKAIFCKLEINQLERVHKKLSR